MPIIEGFDSENRAIITVTNLMAASARTAPKGRGVDNISTAIVTGEEREALAKAMERKMKYKKTAISL